MVDSKGDNQKVVIRRRADNTMVKRKRQTMVDLIQHRKLSLSTQTLLKATWTNSGSPE